MPSQHLSQDIWPSKLLFLGAANGPRGTPSGMGWPIYRKHKVTISWAIWWVLLPGFFLQNLIWGPFLGERNHFGSETKHQAPWTCWGSPLGPLGGPWGSLGGPDPWDNLGWKYLRLGAYLSEISLGQFLRDFLWGIKIYIYYGSILHISGDMMPSKFALLNKIYMDRTL